MYTLNQNTSEQIANSAFELVVALTNLIDAVKTLEIEDEYVLNSIVDAQEVLVNTTNYTVSK